MYELQAQILTESLFNELDGAAVEDAGLDWPQDKYPYETVATVTIPAQDSFSAPRRVVSRPIHTLSPTSNRKADIAYWYADTVVVLGRSYEVGCLAGSAGTQTARQRESIAQESLCRLLHDETQIERRHRSHRLKH